jgi:hypothetical protein
MEARTKPGDRIRLISHNDRYSALAPGTEGTVLRIDHLGTVHVRWDTGCRLSLIPDEDEWAVIG